MVHKPPEPEGAARGRGLFEAFKSLSTVVYLSTPDRSLFEALFEAFKSLSNVVYLSTPDRSLLLLVNTQ